MEVRIFQPNVDQDEDRVAITSPERHPKITGRGTVGRIEYLGSNGAVGETVEYTDAEHFERDIKNANCYGTPMSVVVYRNADGSTIPYSFIFECDPMLHGFSIEDSPQTEVDEDLTENREKLTVVMCVPGKKATVKRIGATLADMQAAVGGDVETYPLSENAVIVCNEEGILQGLPFNRAVMGTNEKGNACVGQLLFGAFFICGDTKTDFVSLTEAQQELYLTRFEWPQYCIPLGNGEYGVFNIREQTEEEEE